MRVGNEITFIGLHRAHTGAQTIQVHFGLTNNLFTDGCQVSSDRINDQSLHNRIRGDGIITGQGKDLTPAKGFVLSLVYVLAMAVTYTIAGVFAALSGENLVRVIHEGTKVRPKIILFSSLPVEELEEKAFRSGADSFLCKTEGMSALHEKILSVLGGG